MRYTIKNNKSVSHHGLGRVVAVLSTVEEGHGSAGVMVDMPGVNGLRIKLVVQPADFDDEASHTQLVRLAARIQLMATAALNRRSSPAGGVP